MLPLNSPRWANLKVCFGYAQHIADEIQCVYDALDAQPRDDSKLNSAVEQMLLQCEDLDHQQTTYTAAGAAVPHYVELLPRLEIETQVDLLWIIATLHYDGAGSRLKRKETRTPVEKETHFEDLANWYDNAISDAKSFAINLAQTDHATPFSEFRLFEAVANLIGDNSTYYFLRDTIEFQFMCPSCDVDLIAEQQETCYQIRVASSDSAASVLVSPSNSLDEVIKRPYYVSLLPYYEMMVKGNRTAILNWLKQVLGEFPCPACDQDSFIAYDDFFRR